MSLNKDKQAQLEEDVITLMEGETPEAEIKQYISDFNTKHAMTTFEKQVDEYERSLEPELARDAKRPLGPGKGGGFVNAVRGTAADFFPNTYESVMSQDDIKRNAGALLADITSPGRVIASLPSFIKQEAKNTARGWSNILRADEHFVPVGESSLDVLSRGMRDTEGTHPVGKVVRSSATGGALLAAIPTMGASLPATFGSIGLSALAGAGMEQNKNYIKHKEVEPVQFTKDLGYGIVGGGLGVGGGKVASIGVRKLGTMATKGRVNAAVDQLFDEINPTGKQIERGFTKDVLRKHEIIGNRRDPSAALQKTEKLIQHNADEVEAAIKSSDFIGGEPTVDITTLFNKMSKNAKSNPDGYTPDKIKALETVHNRVLDFAKNGKVKLSDVPKVKKIISNMRGDWTNPPGTKKILGEAYHEIDNEFITQVGSTFDDASKAISNYEKAQKRLFKNVEIPPGAKVGDVIPGTPTNDFDAMVLEVAEKGLKQNRQLMRNAEAAKKANTNMSELIPIRNTIEKKIKQGYYDKQKGFFGTINQHIRNVPNLLTEIALHSVAPTLSSGIRITGLLKDKTAPSLAKTLIRNRETQSMKDLINLSEKDLEKILKSPQSEAHKNLPLLYRRNSQWVDDRGPTLKKFSEKELAERKQISKVREAMRKQRTNKMSTFGVIGGQNTGGSTREY